jgi:hypothetical protein
MTNQISVPSAVFIAVIVGAAGFALGRSTSPSPAHADPTSFSQPADPAQQGMAQQGMAGTTELPPGHPAIGDMQGQGQDMQGGGAGAGGGSDLPPAGEASITWTAPARWKSAPNPSAMRLATYKIPHAPGDAEDAELSITQVGGGVDSNIDRWIAQFGPEGQKTAQRTTKTVKGMKVTFVQIEGTFSGGMGPAAGPQAGWALLGAIVETQPMPHFFKITGPAKSVKAARAELEGMIDTIAPK